MGKSLNLSYKYPFDQFSRQKIVFDIATKALNIKNQPHTDIIDLGGHKGITREFFNNSNVTILDVYDEYYPGYVKGDATKLKYSDRTFDLAVSFDVLEHIARSQRKSFIKEAVRVSKTGAFIAAPFDDERGTISKTEKAVNELYKSLHGHDHQWLQEHIENKIPTTSEFESLLDNLQLSFVKLSTNDIKIWTLLQSLVFIAEQDPDTYELLKRHEMEFNVNLIKYDSNLTCSYRKIYFISQDKVSIEKVKQHTHYDVENTIDTEVFINNVNNDLITAIANIVSANNIKLEECSSKLKASLDRTEYLERLITEKANMIKEFKNSTSWKITAPLRRVTKKIRKP